MRRRALALLLPAIGACAAGPPGAPAVVNVAAPGAPGAPADAGPSPAPRLSPEERKAAERIELRKPTTTAGLAGTTKAIDGLRPVLGDCFVAALKRDPQMSGGLVLRAKIDATGKVTAVKMEDELGLDVDLASCLVNAVRAAAFPAGSGGTLALPIRVTAK